MKPGSFLRIVLCLFLLLVSPGVQPTRAQEDPPPIPTNSSPDPTVQDPSELLAPDGTLDIPPGLTGSYNVDGWQMALDEQGQPHFYPPQAAPTDHPDDPYWSHDFMLGVETIGFENGSYVFALAVMGGQKVFVGGDFNAAGGVPARNIACWDSITGTWQALGDGVNSRVKAIAVHGSYVYVGGNFTYAGGIPTGPLARWDDNARSWSALGTLTMDQVSPEVDAIEVAATGEVYIGGQFTSVDGIPVHHVAKLDTTGWHDLAGGVTAATPLAAHIYALTLSPYGKLYAGGIFTIAGGYPASNLAQWDGVSWHSLGGGVGGFNATVNAIAYNSDTSIYAGGGFTEAYDDHGGTVAVSNIAMWNGATWSDMDGGVNSDVYALRNLGSGLYVAGRFSMAGDSTASNLAVWHFSYWGTVKDPNEHDEGTDGNTYAIESFSDYLVIGGMFEHAGDHVAHHVAALNWDNQKWVAMGGSVNATVYALTIADGYVYAGGTFSTATNLFQGFVARWFIEHNRWYLVGNGLQITGCTGSMCITSVRAIAVDGDDVYIGGNFTNIGGLTVHGIARFNYGSEYGWHALGSGIGCTPAGCIPSVRAIVIDGELVYIGGYFSTVGGVAANNVAVWNGSSWSPLMDFSYNGTDGTVYALALGSNRIYVGGNFHTPEDYIALWNGSNWAPVGTGINGIVYCMANDPSSGSLYIGGAFTNLPHIARFYRNTWLGFGPGLNGTVLSLTLDDEGDLYAGGNFTATGDGSTSLSYVAHWYNATWHPLGSGVNGAVNALAVAGRRVMAGGAFTRAGGYPSYFVGSFNKVPIYLPIVTK
jgi:stage V sporulation protein SpoVS